MENNVKIDGRDYYIPNNVILAKEVRQPFRGRLTKTVSRYFKTNFWYKSPNYWDRRLYFWGSFYSEVGVDWVRYNQHGLNSKGDLIGLYKVLAEPLRNQDKIYVYSKHDNTASYKILASTAINNISESDEMYVYVPKSVFIKIKK